ncbi:hypothetical protein [Prescottella agglutinans]|uniref:Lipoprotein n=1 Tax=Prescottella agglutinans TaxID=1644129 RepID=A0ABT6MA08_9NOCA|nr:hypothetical protein [Prescottella agglutinans]MDH6281137.1 hypothetical protein [Prescottella agglutinans]
MSQTRRHITSAAAVMAVLTLTSCVTNHDVPDTFKATITFTGNADRASADTGECTIEDAHVAPNDIAIITSGTATTTTTAALRVDTIAQHPDGTTVCTYTAHFTAVPANQRRYDITLNRFTQQSFTGDELKSGATYRLQPETP